MQDFEEVSGVEVGEGYIGGIKAEIECFYDGGLKYMTVFVNKDELGDISKTELLKKLTESNILIPQDEDMPSAELSVYSSEDGEVYVLDIIMADEDYVYGECGVKLRFE